MTLWQKKHKVTEADLAAIPLRLSISQIEVPWYGITIYDLSLAKGAVGWTPDPLENMQAFFDYVSENVRIDPAMVEQQLAEGLRLKCVWSPVMLAGRGLVLVTRLVAETIT
jgi:hypothetical protein